MKQFFKNNYKKLIISSLGILFPIIFGLIFWNKLPETIATHWGVSGEADGFSSKAFAVFAMPAFLLAVHWLCMIATSFDKKNINQTPKAMGMIFWICPLISLYVNGLVYSHAFGYKLDVISFSFILFGIMFAVIGNYLPKIKQNNTLGIKISWTLANEENWNATHRFCGKVWVAGGIIILFLSFLPMYAGVFVFSALMVAMIFIPIVYSYNYYKKQIKNGTAKESELRSSDKKATIIILIFTLVFVAIVSAFAIFELMKYMKV